MFGSDEHYAVHASSGNLKVGDVQRLRVNVPIQWNHELFAETQRVDVAWGQNGFGGIGPGALVIVLSGGDHRLRVGNDSESDEKEEFTHFRG